MCTLFYYHKNTLFKWRSDPNYKKKLTCTAPLILEQDNNILFKNKIKIVDFWVLKIIKRGDLKKIWRNYRMFSELDKKKMKLK